MGTIYIVCGWCGKDMGTTPGEPVVIDDGKCRRVLDITHGICAKCKTDFLAGLDFKDKGGPHGKGTV